MQIGGGAAQRHEVPYGVPAHEWRLSLLARRRGHESFQESSRGRPGVAVCIIEHAPREACPHVCRSLPRALRKRIESLAPRRGPFGTPAGSKQFAEPPAPYHVPPPPAGPP